MELMRIFYKELPVDENNIFMADITEKNKVENVRSKKPLEYVVTGLFINQDTGSAIVTVTDIDRLNFLSSTTQKLAKEKLDLKTSNPSTKELIIPLKKNISSWLSASKTDILQCNEHGKWRNRAVQLLSTPWKNWFCYGTSPN